jgi:hypothetical protein
MALMILCQEDQTTWDGGLSLVALQFNATWHESTKETLEKLFLGHIVDPLELQWVWWKTDSPSKHGNELYLK